jgi:hypothetical protein
MKTKNKKIEDRVRATVAKLPVNLDTARDLASIIDCMISYKKLLDDLIRDITQFDPEPETVTVKLDETAIEFKTIDGCARWIVSANKGDGTQ